MLPSFRGDACHNTAGLVDFEPFTASDGPVFTILNQTPARVVWHNAGFTAAYTDQRVTIFERTGSVILGCDDNASMPIGESVFFIDDYRNESVRELLSPIVGTWNALYHSAPFPIDVHELVLGIIVIPHRRPELRRMMSLLRGPWARSER